MLALEIVTVIVLCVALGTVIAYNSLVRKRNRTDEAWSQIDVELKRRHDLVPNLVQTVRGYATHESGTFEAVTDARASAVRAGAGADPSAVASAENALSSSLRSLLAVAGNYPVLRAQEGFLALQGQLATTEDKLEYARRYYNASARVNHATAAMCIDDPLQHHTGRIHRLFDTHPPIADRIAVLERMTQGLSV